MNMAINTMKTGKNSMMKAAVYTEYGAPEVLQLQEVARPTPKDNELLIRVYATPVNYGDTLARNLRDVTPDKFNMPFLFWVLARTVFGFNTPKVNILGSEFAGQVDAVGKDVTLFKKGDAVFGFRGMNMGANAEYVCIAEAGLVALKPANVSYEQAATMPGGALTALNLLRAVNIQPGQRVLVNGASGGIGAAAVQLAKYYGAHVTGVCGTPRLDYVRALGADEVIDYTQTDLSQNGETYDVIFDILGKSSFDQCKNSLTANGRYLLASFKFKQLRQMLWTSIVGGKKVICALSGEKQSDMLVIKELVEKGKLTAVIDRCYPLAQTAEAHRYVETGRKTGSVVITI